MLANVDRAARYFPVFLRCIALVVILFAISSRASTQEDEDRLADDDGNRLLAYMEQIEQLRPNTEGNVGERDTLDFIASDLDELGHRSVRSNFDSFLYGHSFSQSLTVTIPGKHSDSLIIVARLNADNESSHRPELNLALLMLLAYRYREEVPELSLRLIFLGGDNNQQRIGSTYIAQNYFSSARSALLFFNLRVALPETILDIGKGENQSPTWLLRAIQSAARQQNVTMVLPPLESQLALLNLTRGTDSVIAPYLEANIPALGFASPYANDFVISRKNATAAQFGSSYIDMIDDFMKTHSSGLPDRWERHHIALGPIILGETAYIIILLAVIGLSGYYIFSHTKSIFHYWRHFLRRIWVLPLLILLLVIVLFIGRLPISLIAQIRNIPDIWQITPNWSLALMLGTALFAFGIIYFIFNTLLFRHRRQFYSRAAIVVALIALLVTTAISLSYSYIFLWNYCCAIIFSLLKRNSLRLGALSISLIPFFVFMGRIIENGSLQAIEALFSSDLSTIAIIAVCLLPNILMALRLRYAVQRIRKHSRDLAVSIFVVTTLALAAIPYIAMLLSSLFSELRPQEVAIRETIAYDSRNIVISSIAPLRDLSFYLGDTQYELATNQITHTINLREKEPPKTEITIRENAFLSRRTISMNISPRIRANRIEASLSSDDPLLIFESSFQFRLSDDRLSADFLIGINPPTPLPLVVTIPDTQQTTMTITVYIDQLDKPLRVVDKNFKLVPEEVSISVVNL